LSVKHESRKLKDLYNQIENREVVLPNFQRGFVWSLDEQRKLIASMIVQIPIGSTLHLTSDKKAFSARALCERQSVEPNADQCEYVLDGQQRLSTLKNAFYDIYDKSNWKSTWDNLFSNLRVRWFLDLNEKSDFFGLKNLCFDSKKIFESEPREVLDSIIYKKVLKTKDLEKWFHPGYIPKDENGNEINTIYRKQQKITNLAASEKLIPLYEVYKGSEGIHKIILEKVAENRAEELKAEAKDKKFKDENEYADFICDILKSIEPTICENISDFEDEVLLDDLFKELSRKWASAFTDFLSNLISIDMPIILLEQKEAGRAAAIFEEINKGGTALSIYDLIVAKAANESSQQESLTDRIIEVLKMQYPMPWNDSWLPTCMTNVNDNMLTSKFQSIYLNALAISYARRKNEKISKHTISKNYVLEMSAKEINSLNKDVVESIIRAYSFLQYRCGVVNEKNIIYDYMILPIIFIVSDNDNWKNDDILNIMEAWYWGWLFSGKYKERQDDQFVEDIEFLSNFIYERKKIDKEEYLRIFFDELKDRMLNNPDYSDKDTILHLNDATDNIAPKAMRDAILQYTLSRNPLDLLPNNNYKTLSAMNASCHGDEKENDKNCKKYKLHIHHIIPVNSVTKIGERSDMIRNDKKHMLNSPLNLTYISECANLAISDI
jgi:uncharacterized protein with ParB-like and HNH nuclease domain